MSDFSLFLGKFLRHGTKIASLAPSSPWLSQGDGRQRRLGQGRGRSSSWAPAPGRSPRSSPSGPGPRRKVVVLERDADFAAILRERFAGLPNFDVIEGDVRDLSAMLADRGIGRVDHVISGLPVPSFPKDLQRDFFRVVKRVLAPGGTYNQITEIALVYQGLYRKFFDDVRFVFEPRNFPPAGAYYCRGVEGRRLR